ncbi:MAG: DNA gyrase subunit A, partial [Alcaligenaceae bacterium]|nr:DNA gyrase subunit A [Alcaligenaceae bacterium]
DKINDRLHILEGRQIVYLNIEEVIACIRESDEPKQDLMSRFGLTERQAEDILEIRLRQLAKLEGFKIEQEIQEKQALRDELMLLLSDESRMKSLMIQEIKADVKKFGDERRTLIQEEERAIQEQKVIDEEVTVIVSKKGWLRQRQGHHPEMDNLTFKAGDELGSLFCCRSVDDILVFDPEGRVYTIAVHGLPSVRAEGVPISSLVELQSQPFSHVIADAPDTTYLFAKTSGLGFVAQYEKIKTRQKAGKHFIDLQDGAALLPPLRMTSDTKHVALLTKNKRLLIISVSELKRLNNGGLGTILINLDEDDVLEQVIPVTQEGMRISGIYRRKSVDQVLSLEELTPYVGKRARKGKTFSTKVKQPTLFGF